MPAQNDPKAIVALARSYEVARATSGPRTALFSRFDYTYTVYVTPHGQMILCLETTVYDYGMPEHIAYMAHLPQMLDPVIFFTNGARLATILCGHGVKPFRATLRLPATPPVGITAILDRPITDWSPQDVTRIARHLTTTLR